jgi:hypothetical protein
VCNYVSIFRKIMYSQNHFQWYQVQLGGGKTLEILKSVKKSAGAPITNRILQILLSKIGYFHQIIFSTPLSISVKAQGDWV